jgi:hypothetical protein
MDDPSLDGVEAIPSREDPRAQLVQRILATPEFTRSPQLAKFLLYICTATFEGRGDLLSEQHIGVEVFGRERDYDSAADTIVRSHALRLRRRLEQFFRSAGQQEPLLLIIPRGGYTPVFVPRSEYGGGELLATSSHAQPASAITAPESSLLAPSALVAGRSEVDRQPPPSRSENFAPNPEAPRRIASELLRHRVITGLLALLCIALVVFLGIHLRSHFPSKRHHILWGQLFTDDQPTSIVLGDSGLVLFHAVARRHVSLHDYLNDDVSAQMPYVQHVDPDFARFLLHRRYTSTVDANALTHLLRLPEAFPERTLVRYSRDMHLNDFKTGNAIMIGAQEAVPWVELFENHMDFVFSIDNPETHSVFLNQHPASGESPVYSSYTPSTKTKAFSVIAFLPNLSGTGNVLLLEGLSMVGTEAAVDLAMDDDRLLPILTKIRKPNGTLPHFEMLLESDTLGESAGPAQVVAVHLHP